MSNQFLINYDAVYSNVAVLRRQLDEEQRALNKIYRESMSDLNRMDGRTNAAFMEVTDAKRQNTEIIVDTMQKLLAFMENSSRKVEQEEQVLRNIFSQITPPHRGGESNA